MAQLLLFSVDTIRGAIPLEETLRVIRMVQPDTTNDRPEWEAGSINLHGETLPVISLRTLFGLEKTVPRLTDMLIITHHGSRDVALWVDATSGVQEIPLSSETAGHPYTQRAKSRGVQTTAEGILVIYDLDALIVSGGIRMNLPDGDPSPVPGPARESTGKPVADTNRINAVLAERAMKIAKPEEGLQDTRTVEVLRFRLAYREYAIEMQHIREVILTGEITPVPGTPDFVSGICVVRGEIISLVDLRVLLAIPETGLTDLNRVIVLTDKALTFGILADHITGIGTIELNRIVPEDVSSSAAQGGYIKGVADGSLVVLDTRALFSDPRMIIDET